ncbi:MAG: ATP-dependent zinc metalloprotease FtsH, partial [Dehalococcoidales bacterium]|nr:ATP-dependent zinc metalloprotease FtsH [Dehalococcoidales bacterium]
MRSRYKSFAMAGWILFIIMLVATTVTGCRPEPPPEAIMIDLSQAVALSNSNNIAEVRVEPDNGWMLMEAQVEGGPVSIRDINDNSATISNGTMMVTDIDGMNTANLQEMGFIFPEKYSISRGAPGTSETTGSFMAFLPLLFFGLLLFLLLRMGGNAARGQMNEIGRSKARLNTGSLPSVTFADVAGVPEAKQDLLEVVDFLKNQRKFQKLGARVPKGVMLVGPPGTGKTLLAKAVAGEAGVPFFSLSGSEFVEVYVGVGASRVRDLFQKAKTSRPSIIFIDEIDAVGRKRSIGPGASHEEREQTLNQILSEMDGFTPNSGVIVLAATNRVDVLDPALLRPGRFDRQVVLDNPDSAERKSIIQIHIRGKPLAPSVNLDVLAKQTAGFSGADLANMVNEAAILAARRDKDSITQDEFNESIDRVIAGPARKSRQVNAMDKKRTAYHEGGHAVVARMLPDADPLFKVSIVARGGIGGYTRTLPEEEHYLMTKEQLQANLAMLLAVHTAEKMIFGNVSTGPHNDIKQATEMARKMITEYGMSDKLALRTYGGENSGGYWGFDQKNYGEDVAR